MEEKRFKEIIQFAIEKENEAYRFYSEASQNAKYSGGKDLFLSLAKEEEGHRKLLENLNMEKVAQKRIEKVPDLHISDYMVEVEMRPDLSYADTLRVAMKREEKALKLYTDLQESNADEDLKQLFTFLANEEAKHKFKLEKIYDDEILK